MVCFPVLLLLIYLIENFIQLLWSVSAFTTRKNVAMQLIFVNILSFFLYQTLWQAAHGDLERGHSRASWGRHLFAATRRPTPHRPLCDWVRNDNIESGIKNFCQELDWRIKTYLLITWVYLVCVSLQEVNAAPVRFISDLLVEDSWSHVFMNALAPRGFVKVREDKGKEREIVLCGLI